MTHVETLILTGSDIRSVMTQADYLAAAEQAFEAAVTGAAHTPAPLHLPFADGAFHAKGASIALDRHYAAVKLNGNFPANATMHGLPTIQGAILLADGSNGRLLAILDSIEVTLRRTAAASALAARHLARPDSERLLVCGCGEQGRSHVDALSHVLPLRKIMLWDSNADAAALLAAQLATEGYGDCEVAEDLDRCAAMADVIACCTSAGEPYLHARQVRPGTFVAAVGADSPAKSEISPNLMAAATVVADSVAQCLAMGDLSHAVAAGAVEADAAIAELGQLVTGSKTGRRSDDEIIIFDSTGMGVQDVVAAIAIYGKCVDRGSGRPVALNG